MPHAGQGGMKSWGGQCPDRWCENQRLSAGKFPSGRLHQAHAPAWPAAARL